AFSKAHRLARAYSGAFLVRSEGRGVVVEADSTQIVDRILDVLAEAGTSLSRMDAVAAASSSAAPPPIRVRAQRGASARSRAGVHRQRPRPRGRRLSTGVHDVVRHPRSHHY